MKGREFIAFWLALAILGAVAVMAYRNADAAAGTLAWVERAHAILRDIDEVNGAYSRAVTARRTYTVAGDESQLAERQNIDQRLKDSVSGLREALVGDSEQLSRLDALVGLIQRRLDDLDGAVGRRRTDATAAETPEGLTLATGIRAAREEMAARENRLLSERYERTRRDVSRTKVAEIAGTFTSFAILLLAFGRIRHEMKRRQVAEREIQRSHAELDSIVENIPNMIFVKDADELRFQRINRAGEELLGIARAELVGKSDLDFFPRPQADAFRERDRETLAKRIVVDVVEEPIQTTLGPRWLHTKKVPILDDEARPVYLLGISEDITERRKTAEALQIAKETVEVANAELEAFGYSIAHDLRAPLRVIDGFSQALEEDCADKLDARGLEHLGRVRSSARRMGQLIEGLLALSHVARDELVRETVDLSRLARQCVAHLREAHPDRRIEAVVGDGLTCEGDARLLSAVLDNLLGNAWKFTQNRPNVRVEVGALEKGKDGKRVFFVKDNGAGFDQAYAGKLFGAFQRLHSQREFEGTGIGLATVQRIIRRHGGRIWAEGAVDEGAAFYFTL